MKKDENKKLILLFTFILMIFFEPQMFKENSFIGVEYVDYIYKAMKIIAFIITLYQYILMNKTKVTKILVYVSALQLTMFLSTLVYGGDIIRFVGPAITTITMTMIAEILINKKILFDVLKNVNNYFVVCFIINVISIVLIDFTEIGKYISVYFMGIDNRFIFTLLPWILFEGIVSLNRDNKLNRRWKIVVILSELVLLYKFSVSAMICIGLYLILFIKFLENKKMSRYNNSILVTYVMSNILILLKKIRNIFAPLLGLIGKDTITLSGRTYLWEEIIKEIYKYPLIGRGMQSLEYDKHFFYNSTSPHYLEFCKVSHAHNSLMTLLYRGGIVSVSIYLAIVAKALKCLKDNMKNKYSNILLITLIIILITSIFDTMDFAALYFIITMIINIKELDIRKNKIKEREIKEMKISIVTSIYNGNKYLNNYLTNISKACNKMKDEVEVIWVNDSPEIEIEYNEKLIENFKLRIINNKKNVGIHESRCVGVREAESDYILFLDQDDEIMENTLTTQFDIITKNEADLIVGNGFCEDKEGLHKIYENKFSQKFSIRKRPFILARNFIVSPGHCLIRKDSIPEYWLKNTQKSNGADDYLLWLLMMNDNAKICCNYDTIYIHKYTGGNLSLDREKMYNSQLELLKILNDNPKYSKRDFKFLKRAIIYKYKYKEDFINESLKNLDIFIYNVWYRMLWRGYILKIKNKMRRTK